ncbi:MAG: hypothetical protein MJZ69_09825 [Bacteroidaceae bacterium]|nr:hypothetical protein [Bacteroidaceae bacterium]
MKIKFLTFIACFAIVATSLVGCKDDNIPEKGSEPGVGITEPDERLTGVWLLKSALNPETNKLEPVELEESAIFVASIQDHEAIYHELKSAGNKELAFYADADSLVIIDANIIDDIEKGIKNAGIEEFDFTQVSPANGNDPWFSKFKYEIVDNDSLVLYWRDPETSQVYYGGYSRMKDVEEAPSAETKGFFSWVADKFKTAVETVSNIVHEKARELARKMVDSMPDWMKKALDYGVSLADFCFGEDSSHEFNPPHSNTKDWENTNWISKFVDDIRIGEICIPGAHDACTGTMVYNSTMSGFVGIFVNADCQSLSISGLLNAGVRYLDVRTRSSLHAIPEKMAVSVYKDKNTFIPSVDIILSQTRDKEEAWAYHGPIDCNISLENVFAQVEDFLEENKNEFVIMRVAREALNLEKMGIIIPNEKETAVRLYHETEKKHKDHILAYRPDMKLSEARGKILLFNDDLPAAGTEKIGSYYVKEGKGDPNYTSHLENTGGMGDQCNWWEQNIYEIQSFDETVINQKINAFIELASRAKQYYNENGYIMAFNNQLNANTNVYTGLRCDYFAGIFNHYAYNMFIKDMENKTNMFVGGLYSMDYAGIETYHKKNKKGTTAVYGESMVWAIIDSNFQRLETKE